MAKPTLIVALFVEDKGQEAFCRHLIGRLSRAKQLAPVFNRQNVEGGAGKALTELRAYQRALQMGKISAGIPDLLVVVIDGNCKGFQEKKKEIQNIVSEAVFPHFAVGCPNPHVEKWYLADAPALSKAFGRAVELPDYKCERDYYKTILSRLIRDANGLEIQEGAEYADDIVKGLDLDRPLAADESLADFIHDLNAELLRISKEEH